MANDTEKALNACTRRGTSTNRLVSEVRFQQQSSHNLQGSRNLWDKPSSSEFTSCLPIHGRP